MKVLGGNLLRVMQAVETVAVEITGEEQTQ